MKWKPINLEELSEDTQKVYDVLNHDSDIACIIIGTSYLSEVVAGALKEHFIGRSTADKLLDPSHGVLGSYAARTELAYCLRLVNEEDFKDLKLMSEIRNRVAHSHLALSFKDQWVRESCQKLQAWRVLTEGDAELPKGVTEDELTAIARNQFGLSLIMLGNRIHLNALGRKARAEAAK